jgi:DNA-3-methyladenine glycosylase II
VTFIEKLFVTAVPPFNFDLSAQIFVNGDPQVRSYEKGSFLQVIRIGTKLVLISIESIGTVENPKLSVELKANLKLSEASIEKAKKIVSHLFNLDFDLTSFYKEARNDAMMKRVTSRLFGLKCPTTQFAFEALVDSIVEQQISLKVANTFERRIIKKWGDCLKLGDEVFYAYPTPKNLATATQEDLRSVGLSERKAEYIRNIASIITAGKLNLETLKTSKNVNDIIEELDKIKGVGVWTAELTMLRGMSRLEALPADDLGLRRTISHYYCSGKPILSFEARKIAENWGKWKGLAAYYLIIAEIVGIDPGKLFDKAPFHQVYAQNKEN